jgi:hypothetical protein
MTHMFILEYKYFIHYNTISSHQLLKSGLSVSPVFVCWDAWLCRSSPPWWAQCLFPAEHGSLRSLALLYSPLLHPFLGVRKTPHKLVDKPRWIRPPWSRLKLIQSIPLAVSLLATRLLSMAPLYGGLIFFHNVLFYTGVYDTSIFSRTQVHQATVPMHSIQSANWFNIFPASSGCFLCHNGTVLCLA